MNRYQTTRTVILLLAIMLAFSGCLFSSSEDTKVTGRYVAPEVLDQVQVGNDKNFVLDLLGEPTSRTSPAPGTDVWKWEYTRATTKKGAVFLLLASSKTTTETESIFVEFKTGRVTRTWRETP